MFSVIYTFDKSTLAIPWCVGAIALVAGLIMARRPVDMRFKLLPFVVAFFALVMFAPAMQNDRIEITSESFHLRTGAWWSPNEHRFLLSDVVSREVVTVTDLRGRAKRYMRVTLANGITDDVPMGNLFRAHESDILERVGIKQPVHRHQAVESQREGQSP